MEIEQAVASIQTLAASLRGSPFISWRQ